MHASQEKECPSSSCSFHLVLPLPRLLSIAALTKQVTCYAITPPPNEFFVKAATVPSSCLSKTTSLPGRHSFSQPDRRIFSRCLHKTERCAPSQLPDRFFPAVQVESTQAPLLLSRNRKLTTGCLDLFLFF